ncbi:MAG: hypothetical protein IPP66_05975 [Anaerolineales bacterium]|nr:hypothetical protein [Anaerolineales bacterium]
MSNNYLRQNGQFALDVFPGAIILVDENHIIKFINPAAVRLFQISNVDTFLENSFSSFPGGSGLTTYLQRVDYHNRVNEVSAHKTPIPQPNDEQKWSTTVNGHFFNFCTIPMHDEQNQDCGFIIWVDEWTGERKATELLHALFSELLTPLHSILGFSELLLQENTPNTLTTEQREWATAIKDRAKKLVELRESIIEESKKQER